MTQKITPKDPYGSSYSRLDADQVKISAIKQKHSTQLENFETWAATNQWQHIHDDHYDWWMFPVEKPSTAYGAQYAVGKGEIEDLKSQKEFMKNYRRGVVLVVLAWGWDLENEKPIAHPKPGQQWTGYGVRLAKMSDSLHLFGEKELHKKLQNFFIQYCLSQQAHILISDLNWLKQSLLKD